MLQVNLSEAKENFEHLADSLEDAVNDYVIVTKDGVPYAKIQFIPPKSPRRPDFLGAAKGILHLPPDDVWDQIHEDYLKEFDFDDDDML
ncbi:MAG: hypothetical protein NC078_00745 [Ruminococcus sp.]|nr:hypothetical protein [Ruminococcus sp.]